MTVSELKGMLRGIPGNALVCGLDMKYDAEKREVSYVLTAYKDDKRIQQRLEETLDLFLDISEIANLPGPLIERIINHKML